LPELQRRQTATTNEKTQACWRNVNEIVTRSAESLGKNAPARSGRAAF
jgi:hypothetical protein